MTTKTIGTIACIWCVCSAAIVSAQQDNSETASVEEKWQQQIEKVQAATAVGKFEEAIVAGRTALGIAEKTFGKNDERLAKSALVLSSLLLQKKELEEAEQLAIRAHEIRIEVLKSAQQDVATTLKFLGNIHMQRGDSERAIGTFEEAVQLSISSVGVSHPETAKHMGNLGAIYLSIGRNAEARKQFQLAMDIWDDQPKPDAVYTVTTMTNLAELFLDEGNQEQALSLYDQAIAIQEESFGRDNPRIGNVLRNYAAMLRKIGKVEKAGNVERRLNSLGKKNK